LNFRNVAGFIQPVNTVPKNSFSGKLSKKIFNAIQNKSKFRLAGFI